MAGTVAGLAMAVAGAAQPVLAGGSGRRGSLSKRRHRGGAPVRRAAGTSARHRRGRERAVGTGIRPHGGLAVDDQRQRGRRAVRGPSGGAGRDADAATARRDIDRRRMFPNQPAAAPNGLRQPGGGVRSSGQRRLCCPVPVGAAHQDRQLAERHRRLPLRDAGVAASTATTCWLPWRKLARRRSTSCGPPARSLSGRSPPLRTECEFGGRTCSEQHQALSSSGSLHRR